MMHDPTAPLTSESRQSDLMSSIETSGNDESEDEAEPGVISGMA